MKKIVFMGTPDFAATILEGLIKEGVYNILAVVTQPDRPVGRKRILTPPRVKEVALDHNIEVLQPEKLGQSPELDQLLALDLDLIITAAYGQYVPTRLLNHPQYRSINVHASLLPQYRGGAPIHRAIYDGQYKTGVTIMYMDAEIDAGDILIQQEIPILATDDVGIMFQRLAIAGRDLLLDTLVDLFQDKLTATPQDPDQVSYAPTIKKEEEQLDWTRNAMEIGFHVRAFRPFPTTYTWLNGDRVKVWQGEPIFYRLKDAAGQAKSAAPGTIVDTTEDQFIVACGADTFYAVREFQPAGKKRMPVSDFLKGNPPEELIGQQFTMKS